MNPAFLRISRTHNFFREKRVKPVAVFKFCHPIPSGVKRAWELLMAYRKFHIDGTARIEDIGKVPDPLLLVLGHPIDLDGFFFYPL